MNAFLYGTQYIHTHNSGENREDKKKRKKERRPFIITYQH